MTQQNNSKLNIKNSTLGFTPPHPLNTAVLFLVFNRLDTTKQVFEAIRQAKPPRLYIAADGARETKEGETEKVKAVREYIISNIDWECEVKTLFREQNLGCKMAVSSAITWFFENEEMGIILEDDCLPSQSFFWFCEELLHKYKNENSIYMISGDGRATNQESIKSDYDFVSYALIWGWASWARAWKNYDVKMSDWLNQKKSVLKNISQEKNTRRYWRDAYQMSFDGKINTWDYQWSYTLQKQQALCIVPKVNLITNIGFGEDATHTFDQTSSNANIQRADLNFPLKSPDKISKNLKLNFFYDKFEFKKNSYFIRAVNKIKRIIGL